MDTKQAVSPPRNILKLRHPLPTLRTANMLLKGACLTLTETCVQSQKRCPLYVVTWCTKKWSHTVAVTETVCSHHQHQVWAHFSGRTWTDRGYFPITIPGPWNSVYAGIILTWKKVTFKEMKYQLYESQLRDERVGDLENHPQPPQSTVGAY